MGNSQSLRPGEPHVDHVQYSSDVNSGFKSDSTIGGSIPEIVFQITVQIGNRPPFSETEGFRKILGFCIRDDVKNLSHNLNQHEYVS